MSRKRYFISRILQTIFLLWLAITFLFFMFRLMPGDFSGVMMAQGASEEAIQAFEERWRLNDPLYIQYITYMGNFIQGDLGTSMQFNVPVWEYVRIRIFNTLILVAPAITTGYILGGILGGIIGNARGSRLERFGVVGAILVSAFPGWFTAILLIIIFSGWFGLFPPGGVATTETITHYYSGGDTAWWGLYLTGDFLHHYALPFVTVTMAYSFVPTLTMRTSVIEVSGQDFMFYHRISGVDYRGRLRRLIRHASLPVVTLYPVSITQAISGLVIIETVFNWPGIGVALVQAVITRDFPVLMFVFFVAAAFVIIANLIVDFAYGIIDPRVTLGEEEGA